MVLAGVNNGLLILGGGHIDPKKEFNPLARNFGYFSQLLWAWQIDSGLPGLHSAGRHADLCGEFSLSKGKSQAASKDAIREDFRFFFVFAVDSFAHSVYLLRIVTHVKPKTASGKYLDLRGRLIARGTNLRRWALGNGHPVTTVYSAARGDRHGPVSVRVRRKLEELLHD